MPELGIGIYVLILAAPRNAGNYFMRKRAKLTNRRRATDGPPGRVRRVRLSTPGSLSPPPNARTA